MSRFYVGYLQSTSANIHVSYQDEAPVRSNTFFFRNSFTGNEWTDFSDSSKNYRIDISPRTSSGSSSLSSLISLKLNILLEGFYDLSTKKMRSDTITAKVEVRNFTQPYEKIDESTVIIDSSGTGICHFSNVNPDTDYYFVIRHRNHIETWSHGSPQRINTCGSEYDFTRSDSCAFGRNLFLIDSSPLKYAVYSGDVNQDGTVDATDVSAIDNDAGNFTGGYVATDLNGDEFVDGSDFVIADNNASNFVSVVRP